jgi:hypothetical protein
VADFYLLVFISICVAILLWSMIRLERIYQFPFFMVSVFLSFILPQAISLTEHRDSFISDSALDRMLLYACLCVAMCWIGYQYPPNRKWLTRLNTPIDENKLFKGCLLLLLIGSGCSFALGRIGIDLTVARVWTGPATILAFFSRTVWISFPFFLIRALQKPSFVNISLTTISAFPIIDSAINYGRRQETVILLIALGLCLFIAKNYIPPRLFIVTLVPISAYLIPIYGALRGKFWEYAFAGDWKAIATNGQEAVDSVITGEILELRNATVLIDYATISDQYGYGSGLWDSFIFGYVPSQLVGSDLKRSFQFNIVSYYDFGSFYQGYVRHSGSTLTGLGDSFLEFGFFGCLCFGVMAYLFKTLWISTVQEKSIIGTLLYISLIDSAMLGVTHAIGRFITEFIFRFVVILLITYYSNSDRNTHTKPGTDSV